MRVVKIIFKILFWCFIIFLLVLPIGLIAQISRQEMKNYEPPTAPVFREMAYGSIAQAYRTDVYEYFILSGTFLSHTYDYMEIDVPDPSLIRWDVNVGDEVQEGQVLGTYKGDPVVSTLSGILEERNSYGTDAYLKISLLEPLEMECSVSDSVLNLLKREDLELKTDNGEIVKLLWFSRIKNTDGTTNVKVSVDSDVYYYGQIVKELKVMTGNCYMQALVLDEDCIYQKTSGEEEPWYVRKVTSDGSFISEQQVGVGYQADGLVCVSGISEGEFFDAGYKAIVSGE